MGKTSRPMRANRGKMKKIRLSLRPALIMLLFALPAGAAFGQSRIPKETDNYLQITGQTGLGGLDRVSVVFFEVPDTVTSTLYFAVRSPEKADDKEPFVSSLEIQKISPSSVSCFSEAKYIAANGEDVQSSRRVGSL